MEYVNAVIGDVEMCVPVNEKLGDLILLAQRRANYQKHIAKMRKAYKRKIESEVVVMDSDYIYNVKWKDKDYRNYCLNRLIGIGVASRADISKIFGTEMQ